MRGKCTLTQNRRVSETREFPSYSTFSNRFSKQSFAATRGCCDKRLSGCWFTSYKHFLLGLLTASYIHFWRSAPQRAADLLIILKMSKCCFSCCCLFFPSLTAGHKAHEGTYSCQTARIYGTQEMSLML